MPPRPRARARAGAPPTDGPDRHVGAAPQRGEGELPAARAHRSQVGAVRDASEGPRGVAAGVAALAAGLVRR
eukprot:1285795-Prymnesium_polylepis.1